MDFWHSLRFDRPEMWWLLLLVPALMLLWRYSRRRREKTVRNWMGEQAGLFLPPRRWRGQWLIVLIIIGLAMALARPEMGTASVTPTMTARDLILLIDVSRSMLAEDQPPWSRLRRVKEMVEHLLVFLQQRGSTTRVGIGIFAGRARLVCPPTEDREHLAKVLSEINPESFGSLGRLVEDEPNSAGTSYRQAVQLAKEWNVGAGEDTVFTDFLLVTDGDDVAGDAMTAALEAKERNLVMNVLGVGDPALDWPIPQGKGFLLTTDPATGQTTRVLTRRHDSQLQILARTTGGRLILEESDALPLISWWQADLANRPGRPLESDARMVPVVRSDWVLGGVLVLMALELAFGGARRREW